MPAKQSTITSMAASDAADGFPPGIEVPWCGRRSQHHIGAQTVFCWL